jgi:hypothetical protein
VTGEVTSTTKVARLLVDGGLMMQTPVKNVLRTLRWRPPVSASAVIAMLVLNAASVAAQSFSGPFVGVDVGGQHLIGGSLVDGVDMLQEDRRVVVSAFVGLRGQFRGFVIGGEAGIGRTDGDLRLEEPSGLAVDYHNQSQWHWMLTGGYAIGPRTLAFGYLSEVTRQFEVRITQSGQSTAQQDEQGLLRFGGGVELRLTGPFHCRLTLGSSRANFGDRPTNITLGRRLEASAGVVIQF